MKKYVYLYFVEILHNDFRKQIAEWLNEIGRNNYECRVKERKNSAEHNVFEIKFNEINFIYRKALHENLDKTVKFFHRRFDEMAVVQISPKKRMPGVRKEEKKLQTILRQKGKLSWVR